MKNRLFFLLWLLLIMLTACGNKNAELPAEAAEVKATAEGESAEHDLTNKQPDYEQEVEGRQKPMESEGEDSGKSASDREKPKVQQILLKWPGDGYYLAASPVVPVKSSVGMEPSTVPDTFSDRTGKASVGAAAVPLKLLVESEKQNDITDTEVWFDSNNLYINSISDTRTFNSGTQVPDRFTEGAMDYMDYKRWREEKRICFYDDVYIYTVDNTPQKVDVEYGADINYLLTVYTRTQEVPLYQFDFSDFCFESEEARANNRYTGLDITWAETRGNILYVSLVYNGYARPNTSFMVATSLQTREIIWKSDSQVCNSYNFVIDGEILLCGYGFTDEPDYLYQLDLKTGKVLEQTALKSKPDYLVKRGDRLYVRCYDTDYVFIEEKTSAESENVEEISDNPEDISMAEQGSIWEIPAALAPPSMAKEVARAYKGVIDGLIQKYGEGTIMPEGSGEGFDVASGVSVVRLVDFDGDGIYELYCAYDNGERAHVGFHFPGRQVIYGYNNGLTVVMEEDNVSNPGTDVSPLITFLAREGKVYLVDIHEFATGSYYGMQDGKMVPVLSYYDDVWEGEEYILNGAASTEEAVRAAIDGMEAGGVMEDIGVSDLDTMKTELTRTQETIAAIVAQVGE